MYVGQQRIVMFVGPDRCGKTQIAQEVSKRSGIPYFKASSEHDAFLSSRVSKRELFLNQLRYADPRVIDVFKQGGFSMLFDRAYPCEVAYASVFNRETDLTMLHHLDEEWSKLGAAIILCQRSSYDGIYDDLDPTVGPKMLQAIHDAYEEFARWTQCRLLRLNVDDEDLDREVAEVTRFIEAR